MFAGLQNSFNKTMKPESCDQKKSAAEQTAREYEGSCIPCEEKRRNAANKADMNIRRWTEEYDGESSTLSTLLDTGSTLQAISSLNGKSSISHYKNYLEEEIAKSKKEIRELKDDERLQRRLFLENDPQSGVPGGAFARSKDNRVMIAFTITFLIFISICSAFLWTVGLAAATKNEKIKVVVSFVLFSCLITAASIQRFA